MRLSFDDEESFREAAASLRFNNNPPSDTDTLARQRMGSNSSMPLQERNEDICFNNLPSDPNTTIQQLGVGSSSSTPSQERFEVTQA